MSLSGHVHHFALVISIYDVVIFIDALSPFLTPFSISSTPCPHIGTFPDSVDYDKFAAPIHVGPPFSFSFSLTFPLLTRL